ncbi:MAG: hypothetical protein ACE5ER_03730, partial [Nitrospinaceae bacterium]
LCGLWIGAGVFGCAIPKTPTQELETLQRIIRLYNNEFESRSDRGGAMWVKDEHRAEYLTKIQDINERVSFVNSQILSIVFLKGGNPIGQSGSQPEEKFDEAVVKTRYQFVVAPSISLQTRTIQQRWVKVKGGWNLIPDLDEFFR